MKRVLITGKNSYIGTSLENWLNREPDKYRVETIDMKNESWKDENFSQYDVVFHVAGIVHVKEVQNNEHLYFEVNRDMAFKVAKKAKTEGVTHFIFMSSMSVYGIESGIISLETPLNPKTAYGKSKLEAEVMINELQDSTFKVATLRPPMVYGENCRGNYQRLSKLARLVPFFPEINNKRSMIYIYNLTEFVKQIINDKSTGFFFPQNEEYVNTSEMVLLIAKAHGKTVYKTRIFNLLIRILNVSIIKKMFSDLAYDMNMSSHPLDYSVSSFAESILNTERAKVT